MLNNLLASPTELKPGEQIEGRLIYEVESAEKEWTLVHKETFQKTTDNTTFTDDPARSAESAMIAPASTGYDNRCAGSPIEPEQSIPRYKSNGAASGSPPGLSP